MTSLQTGLYLDTSCTPYSQTCTSNCIVIQFVRISFHGHGTRYGVLEYVLCSQCRYFLTSWPAVRRQRLLTRCHHTSTKFSVRRLNCCGWVWPIFYNIAGTRSFCLKFIGLSQDFMVQYQVSKWRSSTRVHHESQHLTVAVCCLSHCFLAAGRLHYNILGQNQENL